MMKPYSFLLSALFLLQSVFSQGDVKVVHNETAGLLGLEVSQTDYETVKVLTVTGKLNAYDFIYIRKFLLLDSLNLAGVTIEEYDGEVYHVNNFTFYAANEFPHAGLRNSPVKKVVFPSGITAIGKEAFKNSGLTGSVTIPSGITKIDADAFGRCDEITGVQFPSGLLTIGNGAFAECTGLRDSLVFPDGLTTLGDEAFFLCTQLPGYRAFPTSLTRIGTYAFRECVAMKQEVVLPASILSFGIGSFISSGVTSAIILRDTIPYGVFNNCLDLEKVRLPVAKTIMPEAFVSCKKIKTIHLPATLVSMDVDALANCTGLDTIFSDNPIPPVLGYSSLYGVSRTTCKVMVPKSAIELYKAAPVWSEFAENIVNNDTQAPCLVFQYPGTHSSVTLTPSVRLDWNEKVAFTDLFSVQILKKSNNEMVYAWGSGNRVNTDSMTTYLEPIRYTSLLPATTYEVLIAAGSFTDLSGNVFPITDARYEFTTGTGSSISTLDFKKSEYAHKGTQQLGFVKSAIPCMSDLIAQRTYYTHRFYSRDTFTESAVDFTVQQYTDECLYETPANYSSVPYASADTTALVLWQATEYSLYPYSQKKACFDFSGFPSGARITDVVVRVSANAFQGLRNELFIKTYYSNQTVGSMALKGTDNSGFFDYESDAYGNKYYYREIHFPVLPGEQIDSLVVERDGHPVVKIMRLQLYFEVTAKPVVNLGPDRVVCANSNEYLDAGYFPGASYKWSTGAKSQLIPLKGTGDYWVEVTNQLGSSRDTVHIDTYVMPKHAFNDSIVYKCTGEDVTLSAYYRPEYTYLWNTGATTRSIVVSAEGLYTCEVSNGGCTIIDSVGVVNKAVNLVFTLSPCCVAGYDDIQGELYKKNSSDTYDLYDSIIMYGDRAVFSGLPDGDYIFRAHFLKYSNGTENPWVDTYHNGATSWTHATAIRVECDTDTTITVPLKTKAEITDLVSRRTAGFEVLVHPNPVAEKAILTLKSDTGSPLTIRLVDLTGKLVMLERMEMQQGESRFELLNRGWQGLYLLQLTTDKDTKVHSIIFKAM
ncbi:MAG: hypothetical protein BGP01_05910 [Paludibacter sp. 47-17]|nr:MAG: hypothetical protein BGP01_05910 [Paludibacter sp. 47-17]